LEKELRMKKFIVILVVACLAYAGLFAKEETLINFADLTPGDSGQNEETLMDYSSEAGTRYSDVDKAQMQSSLMVENWEVKLTSSSESVVNNRYSYTVEVPAGAEDEGNYMGVRVHFPEGNFNSYAFVKPPFEIPAYATHPTDPEAAKGNQFNNMGVVKNVGVLKNVKINVYGMNFPVGLGIQLRAEDESVDYIPFTFLDFEGWKELVWENPNYVTEVRNREIQKHALYPRTAPSVTLDSIVFYKDGMVQGGDFITYVKDISVTFDQAILEDVDTDINHEDIWGILSEREEERRKAEISRLGNNQVLRFLEEQKMHKDTDTTSDPAAATP
jgi:hypothetical protein